MRGFWNKDDDRDLVAEGLSWGIDAVSDGKTLRRFLFVSLGINLIAWVCVVLFSHHVSDVYQIVNMLSNTIGQAALWVVFGLGMWVTYSLFRLKFPDIEEQVLGGEVMATFAYQTHSSKRWMVWLFSVIGGVVNLLGLILVDLWLTGN